MTSLKGVNFAHAVNANREKFIAKKIEGIMPSIEMRISEFITDLVNGSIVYSTKIYSIKYLELSSSFRDIDFWYKEFAYAIRRKLDYLLDDLELSGFEIKIAGIDKSVPTSAGDNMDFWIVPI